MDSIRYGINQVPFKKFPFKILLLSSFFAYPIYKYNQNKQRVIFMNKIRDRNQKIEIGFEQFQEKLALDKLNLFGNEKSNYFILYYGSFDQFLSIYSALNSKILNITPKFLYYTDDPNTHLKLQNLIENKQVNSNLQYIFEKHIEDLKPDTLYCVSPDNSLLYAEKIKGNTYNQYLQKIQIKVNKYIEKQYISSRDFNV